MFNAGWHEPCLQGRTLALSVLVHDGRSVRDNAIQQVATEVFRQPDTAVLGLQTHVHMGRHGHVTDRDTQ